MLKFSKTNRLILVNGRLKLKGRGGGGGDPGVTTAMKCLLNVCTNHISIISSQYYIY